MDLKVILGPNGSGKSLYAEDLAVSSGSKRLYIATMVPQNQENRQRIEKHRQQRRGKDFITIEEPLCMSCVPVSGDNVILLEDVSNLVANRIFGTHPGTYKPVLEDILTLAGRCKTLIAVSISGMKAEEYDGETAEYIRTLNELNAQLIRHASLAVEMRDGLPAVL